LQFGIARHKRTISAQAPAESVPRESSLCFFLRLVLGLSQYLQVGESSTDSDQYLPPISVSPAYTCPNEDDHGSQNPCHVGMVFQCYRLKNGSQQPEANQTN